jgi:hypothetical protein
MENNQNIAESILEHMESGIQITHRSQLWFEYGTSYFEAAKCLMRCKRLPQTILLLHYSTERLFKALLIMNDEMSESDVKNILNHDGTNYFSLYIAHKLNHISRNNNYNEFKKTIDYDYETCQKYPLFENYNEYIASQGKMTVYSSVFQHFQQDTSFETQIHYKTPFNTQEDFDIYVLFVEYLKENLKEKDRISDFVSKDKHYIFLTIFDLKNRNSFHEEIKEFMRKIGNNNIQQIPLNQFAHYIKDLRDLYKKIHSNYDLNITFDNYKIFIGNLNPSDDETYDFMFDTLFDIFSYFSPIYETLRYPQKDEEKNTAQPLDEIFLTDDDTLYDLKRSIDIIETVIKCMKDYFQKEIAFWTIMMKNINSV